MRPLSSTPPEARSTRFHAPPRLLASVADPAEALVALAAGAGVIDLKDPRRGPLGPCPPRVLRDVVRLRDAREGATARAAVSAALGDLRDDRPAAPSGAMLPASPATLALAAAGAAACGVDFVKVGLVLAGPGAAIEGLGEVVRAAHAASPVTRVIAVAYVDLQGRDAIAPVDLPEVAARAEADGCLLDTAVKDGGTLLDHLAVEEVGRFVGACRERGLLSALAGSLSPADLPRLVPLGPDYIGARGALCAGGRTGRIDPDRLRFFLGALSRAS